jgi:ribonucleoside-diphosphate reductase alpha chain
VSYLKIKTTVKSIPWDELKQSIISLEVMPSMRLLMTAGDAVERDNIAAYNCSYLAINNKRAFSEALYILMNGTGVGFSCERQEIDKLPPLPSSFKEVDDVISVADSKLGWAKAFKKLVSSLWEGDIPKVDYSKVRPAGARLKTPEVMVAPLAVDEAPIFPIVVAVPPPVEVEPSAIKYCEDVPPAFTNPAPV